MNLSDRMILAKFIIEEGITIAKSLKDFHAESELKNLLMNLMVDL